MACNSCESSLKVPTCINNLVIGDIDNESEEIYIYLKNTSSGYIYRQESESNVNGIITLVCTDILDMLQPGIEFELWATLRTSNTRLEIFTTLPYPQITSFECFNIEFERYLDEEGNCVTQETYTLEI